jgi:hypothetical protein
MAGVMKDYGYPLDAVRADYARAGLGLGLCGLPLVMIDLPVAITVIMAIAAGLFALYGLRTAAQQSMRLSVTGDAIETSGWRRVCLAWDELSSVSLAYYSIRREGGEGWMQLRLAGNGGTLRLESTLDGFDVIARKAIRAAAANGLELDRTTRANLRLLGLTVPGEVDA